MHVELKLAGLRPVARGIILSLTLLGASCSLDYTPSWMRQTTGDDFSKVLTLDSTPPPNWAATNSGWATKSDLWTGVTIKPAGWVFLGVTEDQTLVFYRPPVIRQPGQLPSVWVRYEYPPGPVVMNSTKELVAGECAVDFPRRPLRVQVLRTISYPKNNFEGPRDLVSTEPYWVFVYPHLSNGSGTVYQVVHNRLCRKI